MSKPVPQQFYIRKLVKIIHQKEKQLNQYRNLVKRDKLQCHKFSRTTKQPNRKPLQTIDENIGSAHKKKLAVMDQQTHETFHLQMTQNRQFIKQIMNQMENMGSQILQLKNGLLQQQNKTIQQEEQILELKKIITNSKQQISELKRQNDMQKAYMQSVNRMKSNGENQLTILKLQLSRAQLLIANFKSEKEEFSDFFQEVQEKFNHLKDNLKNRTLKPIQLQSLVSQVKNCKFSNPQNNKITNFGLFCESFLDSVKENIKISQELRQRLQALNYRQQALIQRQQSVIQRQQALNNRIKELEQIEAFQLKSLNQSIHGLSRFIKSHTHLQPCPSRKDVEDQNQIVQNFQNSLFKRQEEQLLKQLEQEMKKQYSRQQSIENEKLVQLSQFRETLQATKQVNKQLFQQNMQLDRMLNECRDFVRKLVEKKLLKGQHKDQLCKILNIRIKQ